MLSSHLDSSTLIADIRKSTSFTAENASARDNPHLHAPAYPNLYYILYNFRVCVLIQRTLIYVYYLYYRLITLIMYQCIVHICKDYPFVIYYINLSIFCVSFLQSFVMH
jgi:hypothetical protein